MFRLSRLSGFSGLFRLSHPRLPAAGGVRWQVIYIITDFMFSLRASRLCVIYKTHIPNLPSRQVRQEHGHSFSVFLRVSRGFI